MARLDAKVWFANRPHRRSRAATAWFILLLLEAVLFFAGVTTIGLDSVNVYAIEQNPIAVCGLLIVPAVAFPCTLVLAVLPRLARLNILIFLILWLSLEGLFALLPTGGPESVGEPQSIIQASYYRPHGFLGYDLEPSNRARHVKRHDGKIGYDVIYEIDEFGRRRTPAVGVRQASCFALFFGGSNTFGEGLNGTETLPYYFGAQLPALQAYNYGLHGYGVAQALDIVSTRNLRAEVAQRHGIAVFYFIPGHMDRLIGASNVATSWGRHFSYYRLNATGRPQRHGDFISGRPVETLILYAVSKSNILKYFGVVLPLRYAESDFTLAARVLQLAKARLARTFDQLEFYVVLSPVRGDSQRAIAQGLMATLSEAGISYLDYTGLFDPSLRDYRVSEHDFHQSAAANSMIARQLVNNLRPALAPTCLSGD